MGGRAAYPLRSLVQLRERILDERKQRLAGALVQLQQAEAALGQARALLAARERQIAAARREQGSVLRLAELQAWQRYCDRLEADRTREEQGVAQALAAQGQQQQAVAAERQGLARAQAELQAVEQAQQHWDEKQRQLAERRAELELEDLLQARRS